MATRKCLLLGTIVALIGGAFADPNDFVNPQYVLASIDDPETERARSTIIRNGRSSAIQGPWSVTNSNVRASTNDPRDYLSWAPYHWPDCNWCGQTKDANKGASKQPAKGHRTQADDETGLDDSYGAQSADDDPVIPQYNNGSTSPLFRLKRQSDPANPFRVAPDSSLALGLLDMMGDIFDIFIGVEKEELGASVTSSPSTDSGFSSKLEALRLGVGQLVTTPAVDEPSLATATLDSMDVSVTSKEPVGDLLAVRGILPSPLSTNLPSDPTTITSVAPTRTAVPPEPPTHPTSSTRSPTNPAEFPFRAHRSTKTAPCKTSPTRSMQPSETWSVCPYKSRDGRVNPDVREINAGAYFGQMSQSVLWNAIAWVVSESSPHGKYAVTAIDAFFLDKNTRMNPHVEYGQVVRGPPGTQSGSFMGILDMRGLVKVVNAILMLRASKHPDWTRDRDNKMKAWAKQYVRWVESSAVGKKAKSSTNNHASFYPNQVAALKILSGDVTGARTILQSYFDNQFQDQVLASGEQPLEAARTRPFHYRCFNLEAMITNAKLGDYIGMNLWDAKNKYGATIQTAVNYLMSLDPGHERRDEALPHVAAVAAAYGDPQGKYTDYLDQDNQNYLKRPFWFYNQPGAISRRSRNKRDVLDEALPPPVPQPSLPTAGPGDPDESVQAALVDQDHPPSMFANGRLVELEDGFFIGWDDVREFYRKTGNGLSGPSRRRSAQHDVMPPPIFQDGKMVELEDGLEVDWEDVSSYYTPVSTSVGN